MDSESSLKIHKRKLDALCSPDKGAGVLAKGEKPIEVGHQSICGFIKTTKNMNNFRINRYQIINIDEQILRIST